MTEDKNIRIFSIVSWGSAATRWLGVVLCSHPRIQCLHAANRMFSARGAVIDDMQYMKIIEKLGRGFLLAGDIHGIERGSIPGLRAHYGDSFRAAVVVRDPLQRAISSQRFWTGANQDYDTRYLSSEKYASIHKYLKTRSDEFFAHALCYANAIIEESTVGPVFRCEDLTTNVNNIWALIAFLSNGEIQADPGLERYIFREDKIGIHGSATKEPYKILPEHCEMYEVLVEERAKALYRELGYNVMPT